VVFPNIPFACDVVGLAEQHTTNQDTDASYEDAKGSVGKVKVELKMQCSCERRPAHSCFCQLFRRICQQMLKFWSKVMLRTCFHQLCELKILTVRNPTFQDRDISFRGRFFVFL